MRWALGWKVKQKVLFVATVDSHIELFHLPYLKMFKDRGYEVHVATDSDKKIKYCDKKIKLPIKRSPFRFSNLKAIFALKKILKTEKYDIIHCHTPMGGVVARLAARKARRNGTRVIYTAHGFHFYEGAPMINWMLYYPVEKWLSKYTDTLITINTEDFERAKEKFGKRCFDIQYVPGVGVDEKKFAKRLSEKQKRELRKSLGLKESDKVLICVGRLDKNKNQGFLIKAMKELVETDKKYHLLLVGSDENKGKYQKLVDKLGVSKNVHFLGFREDIISLLQISDVVVSVSKREGLPVNLMEAAFLGLPIVATDCRGNRDVCEKVGGKMVGQGDILDFAKYVERLAEGNKKRDFSGYALTQISKNMREVYFRKKRILHVLATDRFSGAENVVCAIINNLSDEFDMAYCSPYGPIEDKLKSRNVNYLGVKKLNLRNLRRVIRKYNPDIIHAHDYSASVKVVFARCDKKIISQLHNNNPFAKYWNPKTILYALCAKRFNEVLGVSDKVLDEAIFRRYIKKRYNTIYNLIDLEKITADAKAYKFSKRYDLCFMGRESQEKDPISFIKIVDSLKGDNPKIKACMVGDGDLSKSCYDMILKLGLEKNIDMLGFQENPFPIVKNCKACIMPSKWEGFGMAAIEPLVLGKPVYNSGVGGLAEIFKGNEYFICKDLNEYIDKINENKKVSKKTLLSIYSKYTDKTLWKDKMVSIYNSSTGGC